MVGTNGKDPRYLVDARKILVVFSDSLKTILALGSWSGLENDSIRKISHPAGPLTRSKTFNDRDFVAMNKAATKKGLHTATDFSRFRSTHNIEKGQMTMSANTNSE